MFKIAEDLELPANAATQTFAFIARRGAGKTYNAGVLVESLLMGQAQVVVVDCVGVWWGLRAASDGKGPGIPVAIFGGDHGDIPLEPTAGAIVAELVAVKRLRVVLDISEFTDADQRRFVTDFARALFHLKKKNRSPLHLVLEEAQEFLPQMVDGAVAAMVGALLRLWKIGRNFGIGGTLITQRPQALHKGALNLTEVLCTGQLTGPQERKTIAGWVNDQGMDAAALAELPRLPIGTFYVWSPQWLGRFLKTRFLKKRTFDASATPDAGDERHALALSPLDLDAVRTAMAATIEDAKANDPKALREEIARLRGEIANAGNAAEVRDQILAAHLQGQKDGCATVDAVQRQLDEARRTLHTIRQALDAALPTMLPVVHQRRVDEAPLPLPPPAPRPFVPISAGYNQPNGAPASDGDGAARILRALAWAAPRPLTRAQVGVLAVIKPSGGSFGTYLSRLKVKGHISVDGGLLSVTPAGATAAIGHQPGARALVTEWGEKLGGKTREILVLMTDGQERTKVQIAEEVGVEVKGGSFGTYISRLKANGLIEKSQHGFTVSSFLRLR